jgi:hypothetical protein
MKFVVTGTSRPPCRRIASRSRTKHRRRLSSLNRAKSRRWAGLTALAAAAGVHTSSKPPYR